MNQFCVVPENIQPLSPTEGNGNSEGRGSKRRQFPRGYGWPFEPFFWGLPVKLISKLSVMLLQRVEFDRPGERSPE